MIALRNVLDHCEIPDENGIVTLFDIRNLTSESVTQDGEAINVWIGSTVGSGFLQAVFTYRC